MTNTNLKELGKSEKKVMLALWLAQKDEFTKNEITDLMENEEMILKQNLNTILASLKRKDFLNMHRNGKTYFYTVSIKYEEFSKFEKEQEIKNEQTYEKDLRNNRNINYKMKVINCYFGLSGFGINNLILDKEYIKEIQDLIDHNLTEEEARELLKTPMDRLLDTIVDLFKKLNNKRKSVLHTKSIDI